VLSARARSCAKRSPIAADRYHVELPRATAEDRAMTARNAGASVHVREEIVEPIRRTLRWLAGLRDAEGRIFCREHEVEHTGNNAGAIVTACELLKIDAARDDAFLRELAIGQARRLVANLKREGESACFTFRPGRHDPFNCSNSVIDGGAASDALAHLVSELGPSLGDEDRRAFAAASLLHARTYLRYAVLDKGIPAQRAWGLTGLAGAWALEHDPDLEKAAIEAVGMLEAIQHADGSYPYHPIEWGAAHKGSSDVSSFYQSRTTAFLMYSLERMGRDPKDALFREPLARGLDFLLALQGPDGIKCGLVEAKPWYWGAEYEVASHPFDAYALASGWRNFGRERHARGANAAFRAWAAHLVSDGEPHDHRPGPGRSRSYQCPVFWSGHASWMARAARDLDAIVDLPERESSGLGAIDLSVAWFPDAQLARLEDGGVVAWVRGARPAVNVHHGSPHGAGLLRVFDKRAHHDLLERCRLGGSNEAEWSGVAGFPSIARGWRANSEELRFSIWLARVHARAGRMVDALLAAPRVFCRGVLAFGHPRASSAFHLAPSVHVEGDGVTLRSALAHRDGSVIAGSALERRFRLDGRGLDVEEKLVAPGRARRVAYRVPAAASRIERSDRSVSYHLP
jgi:hypothetical protein